MEVLREAEKYEASIQENTKPTNNVMRREGLNMLVKVEREKSREQRKDKIHFPGRSHLMDDDDRNCKGHNFRHKKKSRHLAGNDRRQCEAPNRFNYPSMGYQFRIRWQREE
ncbi:hypothetical protein PoB_002398900 [Plakobranchus ocellatus]|uniref:Uncharacterized protein n=1 Tax=Plakobranchus ocellatus TaxID=259542 RepID=A0AAV3ZQ77_9GAST|nr:hypothetical protein PoB_002398900 [Plakobranchus ocellatus]